MKSMRDAAACYADPSALILDLARSNRAGEAVGLYSICSSNRAVLEAGMKQAAADRTFVCIESTCNQVNQFGGYAGMTPAAFARFVDSVAAEAGLPKDQVILGGDHLGPHVWQDEPSSCAMEKASELVRACVLAGYSKIHLDASMRCADDPGDPGSPLSQELITERAADLCRAAEAAYAELRSGAPAPVYVLGTEVPAPGGDSTAGTGPEVTTVGDLERTIVLSQRAFRGRGLESAWERTAALVVQPGVEFGDASISEYDREKVRPLSKYIETNWHVAFEAHSTDYQKGEALRQMVRDHFAFLKVGPWLTFAFREAVFALELMEQEWLSGRKGVKLSSIREILDGAMRENPEHWLKYYRGDEAAIGFARKYSFSDRSRYYWSQPVVQEALDSLGRNLTGNPVPLMLLSQYLPVQCEAVRQGRLRNTPVDIIRHKIAQVLDIYAGACGMRP